MTFSENIVEHAKYTEGKFTYYAEIICDTAKDIPDPADHPGWEVGTRLLVLENGGSQYRLSNAREWVQVNFNTLGEGGDDSILRTQSIKVYVSPSGSDSNDGMTSGTAFATLSRALEATAGYRSEYIQLAAGTYDVPDKLLSLYKRMVVIAGAGQDDTTIRGCLALYGTNLVLGSLTLDGTDADYADQSVSAPLRAMRASNVRAASSTIKSSGEFCAAVAESSHLDMQSCTFVGASTNCIFVTTFGDATLLSCTDTTGMPLICGGGCTAAIAKSTGISWTAANNGIVWVDGVQRSPVDISLLIVEAGLETSDVIADTADEKLEAELETI